MLKLNFNQRTTYLSQQPESKILREKLIKNTKQKQEEIFNILTAHRYDNFDKKKVFNADTLQRETSNSYEDKKFRRALAKLREIRNNKYLTEKSIKPMITLIKTMQALDAALNTGHPQSNPEETPLLSNAKNPLHTDPDKETDSYSDRLRMH